MAHSTFNRRHAHRYPRLSRSLLPVVETIERRTLFSVSLAADGTLTVVGTDAVDTVGISNMQTDIMFVTVNGATTQFPAADVKRMHIDLLGGNDHVFAANELGSISVNGGGGDDIVEAEAPIVVMDGGDGNDMLEAGGTNIPVHATLRGGSGNDSFNCLYGLASADASGGPGVDGFGIGSESLTDPTVISLDDVANDVISPSLGGPTSNIHGDVENVYVDTHGDATVVGNAQPNVIRVWVSFLGTPITASVDSGGGDDTIIMASGNGTHVIASAFGGAGNDMIRVDDVGSAPSIASATLCGGSGNDTLQGAREPDTFYGGPGTDAVLYTDRAAPMNVTIGAGNDDGAANEGDDVRPDIERVFGGSGADHLQALAGIASGAVLVGNAGNDTLVGADGPDSLYGGAGNDKLFGNGANDLLHGGVGNDSLYGGAGTGDVADYHDRTAGVSVFLDNSQPSGQAGEADRLDGTIEQVYGGSGNDSLVGNAGANALFGNAGNDTLIGNGGIDALWGGAGNDSIIAKDATHDYVDGGTDVDTALVDLIDTVVNLENVTH